MLYINLLSYDENAIHYNNTLPSVPCTTALATQPQLSSLAASIFYRPYLCYSNIILSIWTNIALPYTQPYLAPSCPALSKSFLYHADPSFVRIAIPNIYIYIFFFFFLINLCNAMQRIHEIAIASTSMHPNTKT